MSYNCAPNIGLWGLYSRGQRAALLRSWKSFVVCGKTSLNSLLLIWCLFSAFLKVGGVPEGHASRVFVWWNVFSWAQWRLFSKDCKHSCTEHVIKPTWILLKAVSCTVFCSCRKMHQEHHMCTTTTTTAVTQQLYQLPLNALWLIVPPPPNIVSLVIEELFVSKLPVLN